MLRVLSIAVALGITAVALADNETIVVNTVNDVVDFVGAQRVADLPGPDGRISFREALLAASNTPGPQTINFAIPQSEWWLVPGLALLRLENGAFEVNGDATTIDFTTQTAFSGDTNPSGWEVGIYGLEPNGLGAAAIYVNANSCVIRGLGQIWQRGYGVQLVGNNNRVIGATCSGALYAGVYVGGFLGGPTPTGNVVGGALPGEGNVLSGGNSGLRIDGPSTNTTAFGNTLTGRYAGVEVRGAPQYGAPVSNVRIGGPNPGEGNWIRGAGFIGQEGFPNGSQVTISAAQGVTVEANRVGTAQDGNTAFSPQYGPFGVSVVDSTDTVVRANQIGGIRALGSNHAAGQTFGVGVSITGASTNTAVQGNLIGTNAAGAGAVPNYQGVWVAPTLATSAPSGTMIGGGAVGQGNVIAFNQTYGVGVASQVTGATVSGNSIHDNGGPGIDLFGAAGVTPNDPGDADTGANNLQNFPVLNEASTTGSSVTVTGSLDTQPGTYRVELFAGAACDPSGYGEGATFLGSGDVAADGSGHADFTLALNAAVQPGAAVTATATFLVTGDTSEFSACVAAAPGLQMHCTPDFNNDGDNGTDADIEAFFACLAGNCCATCASADFNDDGDTGTDADIESFFRVLAGGSC